MMGKHIYKTARFILKIPVLLIWFPVFVLLSPLFMLAFLVALKDYTEFKENALEYWKLSILKL